MKKTREEYEKEIEELDKEIDDLVDDREILSQLKSIIKMKGIVKIDNEIREKIEKWNFLRRDQQLKL